MTVSMCLAFCGDSTYAGLEYGRECWCASELNTNAAKLPDANCTLACMGDNTEICGGSLKYDESFSFIKRASMLKRRFRSLYITMY